MANTVQQTVPSYTQGDFDRISGSLDDDQYLQFQSLSQKQRRYFLEQAPMDVTGRNFNPTSRLFNAS